MEDQNRCVEMVTTELAERLAVFDEVVEQASLKHQEETQAAQDAKILKQLEKAREEEEAELKDKEEADTKEKELQEEIARKRQEMVNKKLKEQEEIAKRRKEKINERINKTNEVRKTIMLEALAEEKSKETQYSTANENTTRDVAKEATSLSKEDASVRKREPVAKSMDIGQGLLPLQNKLANGLDDPYQTGHASARFDSQQNIRRPNLTSSVSGVGTILSDRKNNEASEAVYGTSAQGGERRYAAGNASEASTADVQNFRSNPLEESKDVRNDYGGLAFLNKTKNDKDFDDLVVPNRLSWNDKNETDTIIGVERGESIGRKEAGSAMAGGST